MMTKLAQHGKNSNFSLFFNNRRRTKSDGHNRWDRNGTASRVEITHQRPRSRAAIVYLRENALDPGKPRRPAVRPYWSRRSLFADRLARVDLAKHGPDNRTCHNGKYTLSWWHGETIHC